VARQPSSKIILGGLFGSAKSLILASILGDIKQSALIITSTVEEAELLCDEMRLFVSGRQGGNGEGRQRIKSVAYRSEYKNGRAGTLSLPERLASLFPAPDIFPYEQLPMNPEIAAERITILNKWLSNESGIVVAPAKAIFHRTISRSKLAKAKIKLELKQKIELDDLLKKLITMGYQRLPLVEARGDFSLRGGILDIFSPGESHPYRIELLGEVVESIRTFEVLNQRSFQKLDHAVILPPQEEQVENVLHYLPKDAAVVLDETMRLSPTFDRLRKESEELKNEIPLDDSTELVEVFARGERDTLARRSPQGEGGSNKSRLPYITYDEMLKALKGKNLIEVSQFTQSINFDIQPLERRVNNFEGLAEDIIRFENLGFKVNFVSRQPHRLAEELANQNLIKTVLTGSLSQGFVLGAAKLVLYTDREVFGEELAPRKIKSRSETAASDIILQDLAAGTYVVHEDHGIGIYQGLEVIKNSAGIEREYLLIEYAQGDKLYIQPDQIHKIYRYSADSERPPKINRLGTKDWLRTKSKAQGAIKDLTRELLEIYAARKNEVGIAYPCDSLWMRDLESSFPYQETRDQAKAIEEVKADMRSALPMERLLCGDVGFGKTEVALRAAFKAVEGGYQVALLVPTTILAEQHYQTFKERLKPFPVNIEMLSRFKSNKEQDAVVKKMESGQVDIVVGTHRVVQKDIRFKNLGLLIIDEEQRFGVMHKERLKKLYKQIDILTMSATPIPRTLYMSLSGIRNLSQINTPPQGRSPIRTYVVEYNEPVIRSAVLRELERGGQIYFVHNIVETINEMAARIQKIVPQVLIGIAHGQMREKELEKAMLSFMQRKFNLLLCSSIIQSGLDIPNVNTIIVDHAGRFGLADLYQLRGRVGRSADQAYAYLLFHKGEILTGEAMERLKAIQDYSTLGSGYKIAMRDLEIRGAGNLLGAQQHGHMLAVGFEYYCQMLDEAVGELKGWGRDTKYELRINLPVDAYFPPEYIEDEKQRVALYRRMGTVESTEKLKELKAEIEDRFGKIPKVVANLIDIVEIRIYAQAAKVINIEGMDNRIHIDFINKIDQDKVRVTDRVKVFERRVVVQKGSGWFG
jgi:transcription-repair coupling factor (superfamily II helicase)